MLCNCTCQGHGRWLAIYRAVFYIFTILDSLGQRCRRKHTVGENHVSDPGMDPTRAGRGMGKPECLIPLAPCAWHPTRYGSWPLGLSLLSGQVAMRTHEGTSYQKLYVVN